MTQFELGMVTGILFAFGLVWITDRRLAREFPTP